VKPGNEWKESAGVKRAVLLLLLLLLLLVLLLYPSQDSV